MQIPFTISWRGFRRREIFEPARWVDANPPEWGTVERWRFEKSLAEKQQQRVTEAYRAARTERERQEAERIANELDGITQAEMVRNAFGVE